MTDWKNWGVMAVSTASMVGCFGLMINEAQERPKRECAAIAKHSTQEVFYDRTVGCLRRLPDGNVELVKTMNP